MNTFAKTLGISAIALALFAVGVVVSMPDAADAQHKTHIHNKAQVKCQISKIKEAITGDITIDCDAIALVDSADGAGHVHNKSKVKCKIGKIKDSIVGDITINCGSAAIVEGAGAAGHLHNQSKVQCKIGKIKDSQVGDITMTCDGEAIVIDGDGDGADHTHNKSKVKCKIGKIQNTTAGDISIDCDSKAKVIPTPTHKPTPKPTPTSTPTPAPSPEPGDAGIRVEKTDSRDVTRPGHTLTYVIKVTNAGDVDLHDVHIEERLPNQVTITSVSDGGTRDGQTITWKGIALDADESKTVRVEVIVKAATSNGTILRNTVTAKSDDHDVSDEDSDTTVVEALKTTSGQIAGAQAAAKAVPVTAKTGGAGVATLLSILSGASGLGYIFRRGF